LQLNLAEGGIRSTILLDWSVQIVLNCWNADWCWTERTGFY